MATRTKPMARLTCTIHSPGRGSALRATRYGNPRPKPSVANMRKPMAGLASEATRTKSAATTGPTHGAATMPTRSPIAAAPATPPPPTQRGRAEERRHPELPQAEHRRGEDEHHHGEADQHRRRLQPRAEELPGHRRR